ncbi:Zinc finger CCHC domain-containing 8 [Gossypium australe]|uniref:Zinc finger CCHC domain-containing 8 n=1 Tax=Gossypium australe TaxID=47621 RepID=A0A5B6W7F0_9ROSI|nr:Zinc finger CCHC domain-containing 8 [Gossypium australe]
MEDSSAIGGRGYENNDDAGCGWSNPYCGQILMETTKRILEDLDSTLEQKLKGTVSLLKDEPYHWWQSMKYVGMRYVEIPKLEFIELKQEDKTTAKYKAEFSRLNRYA